MATNVKKDHLYVMQIFLAAAYAVTLALRSKRRRDCIGALDGTHIHASVPASEVVAFRGRKPYPTQNVLDAVDFNLRFTYVLAGWEGSAHDALVLRDALERPNGLSVPEGKYYLVDAGYATRPGFLSPYRGVRYHLKEFGSRTPANHKELYNLRHSSARTTIERAFGSLKGRFKILTSRPFFPFKTQAELVLATCILHNYILSGGEDVFIPSEEEWTPHRPPSQSNTREQREEAQEWVAHRETIACNMWANK
ncbi:putative nuclease HARBI1 [Dioscorea cayenensis subsp. rotundata]|uniref:Nuclease HARBI1 n=1 Tax=Dioscorea cayennensis subsp. rotundata TaxID=55577 RepID=A0AB40CRS6_DIOCR|nr:putative nuclease HARBI1 [Dioscorea cayenensis subsp. rotundata]